MSLSQEIRDALTTENGKMPQYKLAAKLNVTQSYLSQLINGKRPIEGVTVGTLEKMFPNATISLTGEGFSRQSIGNDSHGNIQQLGTGNTVSFGCDGIRLRLMDAICELRLEADTQARVLAVVRAIVK